MTEIKRSNSVYFRTIISLTLTTILVFAVLCFVYYQRMSSSIISDEFDERYAYAKKLASEWDKLEAADTQDPDEGNFDTISYLESWALGSDCSIWIVESNGKLDDSSDIPKQVRAQLDERGDSFYLPEKYFPGIMDSATGGVKNSSKSGLFDDSLSTWITAAYPINGGKKFLLVHASVNVEEQTVWMLSNALALPVGVSFAIALVLFSLMTRSIVRPIRLLSDVALKVTQGDLSARIRFPELEKESPLQYVIIDELSMMISTVNGMIERIERQESDRRVFISSIAHDLRTPLTSINGFLSAMMDGTIPPEKCDHYMQIVKTEVDRIQKLTDTMSEASALGQVNSIRMEPFDINELIKETLTNLEKQLGDKNLGVQLELFEDEKGDLFAFGDRQSILRVVYNLLTNAIKFTPEDGTIAITTYYEGRDDQILVSVEDSGLGIPPEQRGRIFDSFYKIDKSRTDTASGSGLGLYICKEILRAHDQTIQVDSSKDLGGSIFTFTLSGIRKLDM